MSVLAVSFLFAAGAAASPTLEEANPQRTSQVDEVCRDVLGYIPIEVEYRGCVDGLAQSLSGRDELRLRQRALQACVDAGNTPGTPAFGLCVVDHE